MKNKFLILVVLILVGLPILGFLSNRTKLSNSYGVQEGDWVESGTPMRLGTAQAPADSTAMGMMMEDDVINEKSAIMPVPDPGYDSFTQGVDRTIIKTASLSLVAEDTRQLVSNISNKIQEVGGVVINSNIYEADVYPYVLKNEDQRAKIKSNVNANMTLRVPVEKLDQALNAIKDLAFKVTSESVSSSDETEQKIDLDAQLNNLKATETQLLELMKQAKTVEETLRVQRELSSTRTQIERYTARLENLEGAAAMSTINVNISTRESELPIVDPNKNSILDEVKLAFRDMVNVYRNLFISGLRFLIVASPVLIVGSIVYFLFKRRKKVVS